MDEQRAHFCKNLASLGYEIEPTNPIVEALLDLYVSGSWGTMVQTEFGPIWDWSSRAKALLEPYKKGVML